MTIIAVFMGEDPALTKARLALLEAGTAGFAAGA